MSRANHLFDRVDQLIGSAVPLVLCYNDLPWLAADRVFVNNGEASKNAVWHLLDIGDRRVGTVAGGRSDSVANDLYLGYYDETIEHGLAVDAKYDLLQSLCKPKCLP